MRIPVKDLFVRVTAKDAVTTETEFQKELEEIFGYCGYVVAMEKGTATGKLHCHARVTGCDHKNLRQRLNRHGYKGNEHLSIKTWNKRNNHGMNYIFKGTARGQMPDYFSRDISFTKEDATTYHNNYWDYAEQAGSAKEEADGYEKRPYLADDRMIHDLTMIFVDKGYTDYSPDAARVAFDYIKTVGRMISSRKLRDLMVSAFCRVPEYNPNSNYEETFLNALSRDWESV